MADLLVSLAVFGLAMSVVLSFLVFGVRAYGWGGGRVQAQQSARAALERMTAELREAGYDPLGAGIEPVVVASPTVLTFQRDLNGNGVVDPTRERVTFVLRPGDTVLRRDAGGGAQPVIEEVRRLTFAYFDRAGAATLDPSAVALVRISLEVGHGGSRVVMETAVSLRNARAGL